MQNVDTSEQIWDKKKIIVTFVICLGLFVAGYGAKVFVLDKFNQNSTKTISSAPPSVEGASTDSSGTPQPSIDTSAISVPDVKATAQQKLDDIKSQVDNLSVNDIASSSPQVQKVINDLKSLQSYPKDQAKQMCDNLCKSL